MPEIVTPTSASAPDGPTQLALLATRVVDVLTTGERDALAGGANLFAGRTIYRDSGDLNEGIETYTGTQWRKPWNIAWGIVPSGYAAKTADQLTVTTEADITSLTITWTALANRYYRTTVYTFIAQAGGANGDVFAIKITDGSNVEKQRSQCGIPVGTNGQTTTTTTLVEIPGAGSITRKARLLRDTGSGSYGVLAAATRPAWIMVEDIGPSGAPS